MNHDLFKHLNVKDDGRGKHTSAEITRQPDTWKKVWEKIKSERLAIESFLEPVVSFEKLNIVLTGAGSSAFIGDTVASAWLDTFSHSTQAIPTTDLVTHCSHKLPAQTPLLLISFARSGNSPESTAAIEQVEAHCDDVYHLIITCNPEGKLAGLGIQDNTLVFLLPPETEDQSLAMTNSFTSMGVAATLIPRLFTENLEEIDQHIEKLSSYGHTLLGQYASALSEVAEWSFNRIVFLGSGSLWGIAKESHLKVQELTNGDVIGKFDSFLGFRHGPKAIINDQTLLVYLVSNQASTLRYEQDLMEQVAAHQVNLKTLAISESDNKTIPVDRLISLNNKSALPEELWAILCTLPAQIIGFYKSLLMSYDPDNPSPDGTISRVVQGVTIYKEDPQSVNQ